MFASSEGFQPWRRELLMTSMGLTPRPTTRAPEAPNQAPREHQALPAVFAQEVPNHGSERFGASSAEVDTDGNSSPEEGGCGGDKCSVELHGESQFPYPII